MTDCSNYSSFYSSILRHQTEISDYAPALPLCEWNRLIKIIKKNLATMQKHFSVNIELYTRIELILLVNFIQLIEKLLIKWTQMLFSCKAIKFISIEILKMFMYL